MHTAISILHIIVSLLLVVIVLFQVGKGATMGSNFGGTSSQALFGGAGPATLLTKITIVFAAVFMLTSLYLTYLSGGGEKASLMNTVPAVTGIPAEPAPTPAAEKPGTPGAMEEGAKTGPESVKTAAPAKAEPAPEPVKAETAKPVEKAAPAMKEDLEAKPSQPETETPVPAEVKK